MWYEGPQFGPHWIEEDRPTETRMDEDEAEVERLRAGPVTSFRERWLADEEQVKLRETLARVEVAEAELADARKRLAAVKRLIDVYTRIHRGKIGAPGSIERIYYNVTDDLRAALAREGQSE